MKKAIFISFVCLVVAFCFSESFAFRADHKPSHDCAKPSFGNFTPLYFRQTILSGTWEYQYSYTKDTCVVLDDLIDVPNAMEFSNATDTPMVCIFNGMKLPANNCLKNISATVTDHWGDKHVTGIVSSYRGETDNEVSFLFINHLPLKDDHIKQKYYYQVRGIHGDTMCIVTTRLLGINDKSPFELNHLFVRQTSN